MKVALLCNIRPSVNLEEGRFDEADDRYEEFDSEATIASIADALRKLQLDVAIVPADSRLPWRLAEGRFDFVFNIAEGSGRRSREAVPAAVCELLEVPYTGSDPVTLGVTLDKFMAKRVVSPDVPAPAGVLMLSDADEAFGRLAFPVIVKPNDEGSSKGIGVDSVCFDRDAIRARFRRLRERYACPVLVEQFLPGPEITVALSGNAPDLRILGMMEIEPVAQHDDFVYSIEVKREWRDRVRYHVPPRLDAQTIEAIRRYALAAFSLLGCRDIARMDFRLDRNGLPHFIECNPLPGLDPLNSDIVILSRRVLSYDQLVQGILLDAMLRTGTTLPS